MNSSISRHEQCEAYANHDWWITRQEFGGMQENTFGRMGQSFHDLQKEYDLNWKLDKLERPFWEYPPQ